MKNLAVLLTFMFVACAHAGGGPSKMSCDRNTYRHFLEQGREVLSIQDPDDFKRHWWGFVNRANTEWKDSLLACGYDPKDLQDNLATVKLRMMAEMCQECRMDASNSRMNDRDWCGKNQKDTMKECLDRADKNFDKHLFACGGKDVVKGFGNALGGTRADKCPCDKGGSCGK
jgi:hypothetical protein